MVHQALKWGGASLVFQIAMLGLLLILMGCQTTGGSYCDITKPTRLSEKAIDALSDAEVAKILTDNETWEGLCK